MKQTTQTIPTFPRVSVIIPAYNSEKYIAETIQSVLDQTYQDFEIVITNDGSADGTVEVINRFRDPRIRLHTFEKNQGVAAATNHCVKQAVGEYIAVIDSDNIFLPEKLERQITFLDEHPEIAAVFTYAHIIDDDGKMLPDTGNFYATIFTQPNRTRQKWLHYFFFHANCLCHPSVVLRNGCYETIGYYDERLSQLLDLDLWIRLCMRYDIFIIPKKLLKFRIRENNSNLSGITPKAQARHDWQISRILDRYLEIQDSTEFLAIFPEAKQFGEYLETDLIPYYLAMLAIENNNAPSKLWALNTLHTLLNTPSAQKLKNIAGFEAIDFIHLTEEQIFKDGVAVEEETSLAQIQEQEYTRQAEIIRQQKQRIQEIEQTLSWKVTKPLRYIWATYRFDRIFHIFLTLLHKIPVKFRCIGTTELHCDRVSLTSSTLSVLGWTLSDSGIDKIEVYFDGVCIGNAKYGDLRYDVQKTYPFVKHSGHSGFHLYTDISKFSQINREEHIVLLKAFSHDGQSREITVCCVNESYQGWRDPHQPDQQELAWQKTTRFRYEPKISIITPVYNTPEEFLGKMIESVLRQTYANWELCLIDDGSTMPHIYEILETWVQQDSRIRVTYLPHNLGISEATNMGIRQATGEFLAFVDHDDELTPHALYEVVKVLNTHSDADMIYTDQDKISADGHLFEPFFKPDWSPEFFRGVMYIGHLLVVRKIFVEDVGLFDKAFDRIQDYEFVLRLSEQTNKIYHIPKILYHWRKIPGSVADDTHAKGDLTILQQQAVDAHLQRMQLDGYTERGRYPHRVQSYPKSKENYPKISVIIPSKDQPEVLNCCLKSLFTLTTYPNFEVIVIDNDTTDPQALEYMQSYPVTCIPFQSTFNFSAANNLGAAQATGEYLVFLNNDTEVITQDWLQNLLYYAEQPDIGAVGPLLLYPDGAVQHAGVVLGFRGTADHVMRNYPDESDGYYGSLHCAREVSAVTAACMMIHQSIFFELDGFNTHYGTIYQDVDLCLKLRERGYRIIYSPIAMLKHDESASRKDTYDYLDRALLLEQWQHVIEAGDPYYNPNFDITRYSERETGYTLK